MFNYIKSLDSEIKEILKNLQVKFSDGSTSKTNDFLQNDLKEYLSNLSHLIHTIKSITMDELYHMWNVLQQRDSINKMFNNQYDVQIPSFKPNNSSIPNFYYIPNIESLASPIVSLSRDNEIICSVSKLRCQIGPIFPSLITNPYSINIISFINDEVQCKIVDLAVQESDEVKSEEIQNKDHFNDWIYTNMTINKFEPVQIFIYPRYLMINEPKTIVFKGNLSIKTKTIKQSLLGFEITLRILPLQIRLRCLEYNLAEEEKDKRKLFRLCCENIDSGSQINFEIINYYIHDHFILNAELESLEENEAEKPEISLNDRKQLISLIFKNTTAPTRCNFLIKIALSQNFVFTILCDVIVIPLVFSFEVYDYYTKRFTKSRFPIFFTNRKSNVLYLRIRNWSKTKKTGKIYIYKPNCISVNCTDIKLDEKFEFKDNIIIPISMENKYDYIPSEKNGNVYITLYVGNKSKTIYFTFFEPLVFPNKPYFEYKYNTNENIRLNNEYLSKYPTFSIKETDKNWIQMRNNNDLINLTNDNKYFVVVTPFHYFTNDTMHKINYNYDNISVSPNNDVSFLQLNPSKNEKNCYNLRKNTFERSYKFFYGYYYSIYGFIGKENSTKDNWFPVFNTYPKIEGIEILPYDEINVDIAKKNIVKMFSDIGVEKINISKLIEIFGSVFNPIVEQTNFAVFMSLLLDYNIILNIISICKLMPITVQSELNLILLDIINMLGKKQSDKMYTIISHNLIVKFASIFKRRFDYLQKRNFILELPISYDEIIAKQKSIDEFDFDMAKDMSKNINAEFIAIQDQMKNIKLKELPNLSTHQECFLINEDKIDQPVPCKIIDKLGNNPFEFIENKESYSSNNMDEFTFLPPIKKSNTFSIKTLNELYSTCSQGATYLPTYVRCQRIKNASQNESEKYFGQLLDIYNETFNDQIVNKSIISTSTKYFHDSFENCIKRLKRAGISFNNIKMIKNLCAI